MMDKLRSFARWEFIVPICYFWVLLFEIEVIFPIEKSLLAPYPYVASLVFLPHAVRVLGTVIVGPKVFFVLFPTILVSGYFLFDSYEGGITRLLVMDAAIGAGCSPLAYLIVKWINKNTADFELTLLNWRTVFLIGAIASVLNSAMRITLLNDVIQLHDVVHGIVKVIVGDMVGLAIGLVALVFVYRLARRRPI